MLVVISPAKQLDYESETPALKHTTPDFLVEAQQLVKKLKKFSTQDLSALMGISDKLAAQNHQRYQTWKKPFTQENARQAILAFKGDVYLGLEVDQFSRGDYAFAQKHLRILSGLYGVLRPLDLMQAYRLEMGTNLQNPGGENLYAFWDSKITESLNQQMKKLKTGTLINLASNEYFRSVKEKALNARVITPVFKEWKNGQYKVLSFFAKKARGQMCAYIVKNKIEDFQGIKKFKLNGYRFDQSLSVGDKWIFTRKT